MYTGTLIVVILTYSNARKTLLSPAHTEYHKNVITRLKELSEKLDSEFDPSSPYYWAYVHPNAMKDPVDLINQQFRKNKEATFVTGEPNRGPCRLARGTKIPNTSRGLLKPIHSYLAKFATVS